MRVVSLVPSDTFSVATLGAVHHLVGRTRYCVEPSSVESIAKVGGTKNIRTDKVIQFAPDLVLANREENTREDIVTLVDAGLDVIVAFPKTVKEGLSQLGVLADRLGIADQPQAKALLARASQVSHRSMPQATFARCFVAIWTKPWMTVNRETYISDVLSHLGLENVFANRPSQSPDGRDTRYPKVEIEEVIAAQPEVILLPDEPYPFGDRHADYLKKLPVPAARNDLILCVSGKDLCWHGGWAIEGIERLRARFLQILS